MKKRIIMLLPEKTEEEEGVQHWHNNTIIILRILALWSGLDFFDNLIYV